MEVRQRPAPYPDSPSKLMAVTGPQGPRSEDILCDVAENTYAHKIQESQTPLGPKDPFAEHRRAQCYILSAEGCLGATGAWAGPRTKGNRAGRKEGGMDNLGGMAGVPGPHVPRSIPSSAAY